MRMVEDLVKLKMEDTAFGILVGKLIFSWQMNDIHEYRYPSPAVTYIPVETLESNRVLYIIYTYQIILRRLIVVETKIIICHVYIRNCHYSLQAEHE